MSRKTRAIQSENAVLHAWNRGVDRGTIFFKEDNYEEFISLLARFIIPGELQVLAYSLLPNHFHVVVHQMVPYAISRYLKSVCGSYAQSINMRLKRTGHLFTRRYGTHIIEDEASLLRLSRYVHMNPVKAGLVKDPSDWRFSSYRHYVDGISSRFINSEMVLSLVGGAQQYEQFLKAYDPSDPESAWKFIVTEDKAGMHGGRVTGS